MASFRSLLSKLKPEVLAKITKNAIKTNPVAFLFALSLSIAWYIVITYNLIADKSPSMDIMNFVGALSSTFPLGYLVAIGINNFFEESKKNKKLYKSIAYGVLILPIGGLTAYLYSVFDNIKSIEIFAVGIFYLVSVLFVFLSPYIINKSESRDIWFHTLKLVFRGSIVYILSGVVYAQLSLALKAIDILLGLRIDGEIYAELAITVFVLLAPTAFLISLPKEFHNKENYPKLLKNIIKFVTLPIIFIYLAILYLYIAKIIINWQMPEGGVVYIILGMMIPLLINTELLNPLKFVSKKVLLVTKGLYLSTIPLMIVYFLAIFIRIDDYGLTINRYHILILGAGLLITAIIYGFFTKLSIKYLYLIVAGLALFSILPSVGAFDVSRNSQTKRLEKILVEEKILINGRIDNKNKKEIEEEKLYEVSSIVEYLSDYHDFSNIKKWFSDEDWKALKVDAERTRYNDDETIISAFGLKFIPMYCRNMEGYCYEDDYVETSETRKYSIHAYMKGFQRFGNYSEFATIQISKDRPIIDNQVILDNKNNLIIKENNLIIKENNRSYEIKLESEVLEVIEDARNISYIYPKEPITLEDSTGKFKIIIEKMEVSVANEGDKKILNIRNINGYLFRK